MKSVTVSNFLERFVDYATGEDVVAVAAEGKVKAVIMAPELFNKIMTLLHNPDLLDHILNAQQTVEKRNSEFVCQGEAEKILGLKLPE